MHQIRLYNSTAAGTGCVIAQAHLVHKLRDMLQVLQLGFLVVLLVALFALIRVVEPPYQTFRLHERDEIMHSRVEIPQRRGHSIECLQSHRAGVMTTNTTLQNRSPCC